MQIDAPKAADHNGYQQIIRPRRGMLAGLKILVSAVQSRPSPPFFLLLSRREFYDRIVTRLFLGYSANH